MAKTKLNFTYGQYTQADGLAQSLMTPGMIVFSGKTEEIYLDGKVYGKATEASVQELIERVDTLEEFVSALRVNVKDQASIDNDGTNSSLHIANIGQGQLVGGKNDGKIYSTDDFVVSIDGVYNNETNKVATQATVTNAVSELRAEIFGTLDPSELEKTLDTIKEIQEVLIDGAYKIDHIVLTDPEVIESIPTTRVVLSEATTIDGEDYPAGAIVWTDGTEPIEDAAVYASKEDEDSPVEYKDGYLNLQHTEGLDGILNDISRVEDKVDGINDAILVNINANKENDFVTSTKSEDETPVYTIGISYGTFKTGHEAVMDAESPAYVDGIATVKDVQDYIEERMCWVTYESAPEATLQSISDTEDGGTVVITENPVMNQSLIISNN